MYQAGLVLEGGGMRGMYTCGVLEFFLEKGIEFSHCYGVSAGSCHLCSYLSKQKKRGYRVGVDYLKDKEYCSIYSLLKTGDLFHADYCYNRIPNELNPYDYETFDKYEGKAYAVATDIETGEAAYLHLQDLRKDMRAIQASSSLPLVSNNVEIDGHLYLDGGISDGIPIGKSIQDGNTKNIVILTKAEGYRRKPSSALWLTRMWYRKYPKVYELMKNRHITYNRTLDYLEELKADGRALVFRPQIDLGIKRIEKDKEKLTALYELGYQDAQKRYEELLAYLDS